MAINLNSLDPFSRAFLITERLLDHVKYRCRSQVSSGTHNSADVVTYYCALERQLVIQVWINAIRKYPELLQVADGEDRTTILDVIFAQLLVYRDVLGFESLNDDVYDKSGADR